jgi:hypothetical protein
MFIYVGGGGNGRWERQLGLAGESYFCLVVSYNL